MKTAALSFLVLLFFMNTVNLLWLLLFDYMVDCVRIAINRNGLLGKMLHPTTYDFSFTYYLRQNLRAFPAFQCLIQVKN